MSRVGLGGLAALVCALGLEPPPLVLAATPPEQPAAPPSPSGCAGETIEIGEHRATKLDDGGLWFLAGIAIDADGSPHAYHPDDIGLDYLANAGKPGNWWALVLDERGQPIIQGPDDPAPGYYVSTTSLVDRRLPTHDPRRYVDAEQVPFIVLPPRLREAGAKLGDLALVIDLDSGARSFAIFADIGPRTGLGEGSIALAEALELPANPRRGGKASGLAYLVWPGSGEGKPMASAEIDERGAAQLERWGGDGRLERCLQLR